MENIDEQVNGWFSELPSWAVIAIGGATILGAGTAFLYLLSAPSEPTIISIPNNSKTTAGGQKTVGGSLVGTVVESAGGRTIEQDSSTQGQHFHSGPTEHQRTGGVHFGGGEGPRPDWSDNSWTDGPRPLKYFGSGVLGN